MPSEYVSVQALTGCTYTRLAHSVRSSTTSIRFVTHCATYAQHVNNSATCRVSRYMRPHTQQLPHTTHAVGGREAKIIVSIVSVQSVQTVANGGARTCQLVLHARYTFSIHTGKKARQSSVTLGVTSHSHTPTHARRNRSTRPRIQGRNGSLCGAQRRPWSQR